MISISDSLQRLDAVTASGALEELCRRHKVELLVLFGSALTAEAPGDIDLAVGFAHGHRHELLDFLDALYELIPGDHLDVMPLDTAGPVALHRALTAPRVLFSITPQAFHERQIFAMMYYMDTQHFRDAILESLAE